MELRECEKQGIKAVFFCHPKFRNGSGQLDSSPRVIANQGESCRKSCPGSSKAALQKKI